MAGGWCGYRRRLDRALLEAGFETDAEFAEAIGFSERCVRRWIAGSENPGPVARRAIARVLEVSPGADCDEVVDSDLDWLLEPEPCDP